MPLLDVKLAPQSVASHVIARPRLVDRLKGDWRVGVVSGGPGTGKTVLAAQWLQNVTGGLRAWVTLDNDDDRPARFWLYVASALERATPGSFSRTVALAIERADDEEALIDALVAEAAAAAKPIAVVLEDLHTTRNPVILAELERLVEHLPSGMQILITTRADPVLPLGRWRARSWLTEVRQRDLALTRSEAEALFAALGEQRLTGDEIDELRARTEGWAAALQLAVLAMRDSADAVGLAHSFTGRHHLIADLLLSEVVDRQSDEIRDFMLCTSVADALDADLCDALTGRHDSSELLQSLEAQALFLVAIDDEDAIFRYHQLLSELLRRELERRHPGRAAQLHRIAATVLRSRGEVVGAVRHLLASGDRAQAFELAFGSVLARWDHADIAAAAAWVDLFPIHYIEETSSRMLAYVSALGACVRIDEATAWLQRATGRLAADPEPAADDLGLADALHVAMFAVHDATADGIECGVRAVEAYDRGLGLGIAGARAWTNLARSYLLVDRADTAEDALARGHPGNEIANLLVAPAVHARIALRRGQLTQASDAATRALTGAVTLGVPKHFGTLDAYLAHAGALTDRNERAAAAEVFELLRELADRYRSAVYFVLARLDQTRAAAVHQGVEATLAIVEQMRAVERAGAHPTLHRLVDGIEARWLLEAGEIPRAEALIGALPPHGATRVLLDARLQLARDCPGAAIARLASHGFGNLRDDLAAELILVRATIEIGDGSAERHIERAVVLAVPERHVLAILEEGPVVTRHVRAAAELGGDATGALASALGAPAQLHEPVEQRFPLTERERAVLRYLPSRLTNPEIARECFLSVNTVKTHVKGIYSKLGVSSRSEAVDRARGLGLL